MFPLKNLARKGLMPVLKLSWQLQNYLVSTVNAIEIK